MNLWLLLPLLLPMLAGLLLLTKPFAEGKIRRLTVQIGLILTLVSLLPAFLTSGRDLTLFTLSDNVEIALHVDGIGICFCVLMAFVWTAAGFYSFDYMAHEGHEKRFYCLYLLTLGVLMGLCMSGSLVTFYMFYEAMTLLTMPLVMHSGSKEAVAAGIKYLIYSVVGASLVLLGIFAIAPYAQSLSFAPGGALDMAKVAGHEGFVLAIGGVMLLGFGAKAGLYPLHGWLPTAHPAAPSPASAVLSGVITKAGVLGLLRVIYCFLGAQNLRGTWVQTVLMALSLLTVFIGSLLAYREHHLKKRLAWSTVSQVSYVVFGLSTLHPLGLLGAMLHVVCHSLVKDVLFMGAGAVILKTGETQVDALRGIGKRMPVTMWCFAIGSLGLIGIPPCLGFFSKWELAQGSLAMTGVASWLNWFGPVVLLSALLTAGYLMPIVLRGFFPGKDAQVGEKCEASASMLIPMLVLTVLSVALGMFPSLLTDLLSPILTALL